MYNINDLSEKESKHKRPLEYIIAKRFLLKVKNELGLNFTSLEFDSL